MLQVQYKTCMPTFDLTDDGEETRLVLDGKVLEDSSGGRTNNELLYADLWGEAIQQIELLSILDFSAQFLAVKVRLPNIKENPKSWSFTHVDLFPKKTATHGAVAIAFRATIEPLSWAMPYSITELESALESVLDANPELGFEPEVDTADELGVYCRVSVNTTIREIISMSSKLPALVQLAESELSSREYQYSVVSRFEFPDPIRSACEQYLLYFVQFLRDLGIEADSELKEEASKVLFAVTPRDEKQALGVIRNALELYLQIPSASNFNEIASGSSDVAVFQLQANVSHFQSQYMLARAILEAKEATITAKDAQISALQQRLDLRQYALVEAPDIKAGSDSEPIIEGVLAVKKFNSKGLEWDLPAIVRWIKQQLRRRW